MNRVIQAGSSRPWFREPWPWFLMSLPATAIVAGLLTWLIAARSDDGLVAQDYYKKGLEINRVLASQERAAQLGLTASLQQSANRLELVLTAEREISPEPRLRLRLRLLNPAKAGLDQVVLLQREGDRYVGTLESVRDGRWNLKLEDEAGVWQLFAETTLPLKAPLNFKP